MNVIALTPDRSDRPEFLNLCKWQMKRQTVPIEHRIMDYHPESGMCDLTQRVRRGCQQAKKEGIDYVIIIENDDYYPPNWIENVLDVLKSSPPVDLAGIPGTTYYNMSTESWRSIGHGSNSSLFCTTISTSINPKAWPRDSMVSLDLHLWRGARRVHKLKTNFFDVTKRPIGIKHGVGKIVTPSHRRLFRNRDLGFNYLRKITDKEYFRRLMAVWENNNVSIPREQRQLDSGDVPPKIRSVSVRTLQE